MSRTTPITETLLAALLVAAAPLLFFFGPDDLLALLYAHNRWLWETFPPNRIKVSYDMQALLGLVSLLAGGYFFVGVWAAYPTWRKAVMVSTVLLLAPVLWLCSQIRAF